MDSLNKVSLRKMTTEDFETFIAYSNSEYAKENIESGRWPQEGSLERAKKETDKHLPDGLNTKDNFIFNIIESHSSDIVGYVWLAIIEDYGVISAFIYDIEIKEEHRRKGFGKLTLVEVQTFSKEKGAVKLGLNVFAQNESAKALYDSMGFTVSNLSMNKSI